jgi:hypothetical protein
MPLYFFLLRDGEFDVDDEEGMELAGDASARDKAVFFARDLLAAAVMRGRLPLDERVLVMSQGGREVLSMTFGQAVGSECLRQPHVRLVG